MILSDREIRAALVRGAIRIAPDPDTDAWSSTALDLRLARELVIWKRPGDGGPDEAVSPAKPDFDFDSLRTTYGQTIQIPASGYIFRSQTFLLGWTVEKLRLPHRSRLAARVEGKSS